MYRVGYIIRYQDGTSKDGTLPLFCDALDEVSGILNNDDNPEQIDSITITRRDDD